MKRSFFSFLFALLCLLFVGAVSLPADEADNPDDVSEETGTDSMLDGEGASTSEEEFDEEGASEDREKKREERTPMVMPSFAPFGEMQRGIPPIVNPTHPSFSERRFRFGTLFAFGLGLEVGDVDDDWVEALSDLFDDFEALEDDARRFRDEFDNVRPDDDELDVFVEELRRFGTQSNRLVEELTSRAYLKLNASASFPLAPIAVRSEMLQGMFSLNADGFVETRGAVFSSDDAFLFDERLENVAGADIQDIFIEDGREVVVLTDGTEVPLRAEQEAGVAVQGGAVGRIGGGYSMEVWRRGDAGLHVGTSLNFFHARLFRSGILLDEESFSDAAEDAYRDDYETSTGVGVDLGATWVGNSYLFGGVVRNLNEPAFDYPDTSDSVFFNANPQARRNGESWTMERQFTLQSAVFSADKRWVLSGAVDLNGATDTTGGDYQWASLLGSFEPRRAWVPSPRLGLRTNMTGEKMTYATAGLSFFRALHLDVSSTLDTIETDGNTVPRGLQASLALGRRF